MTTKPSHAPAGWLVLLAAGLFAATAIGRCLVGCGPLSPTAATAIEGTAAALCPVEGMIPVAGPVAASACPLELAALTDALSAAEAPQAPPVAARVAVYRVGPAGLVHVGLVPAHVAPAVQRALLAPGPAKPPPPVGPGLVDAGAPSDAGREAGR